MTGPPAHPDGLTIRPLTADDLPVTERLSARTFDDADRRTRRVSDPEPTPRTAEASRAWIERARHFLTHDPDGCCIATRGDDVIGFALSQNRGHCWYLWTYGLAPGHQGRGVGGALMDKVLAHAGGRPGMLSSTVHPGATRRYRMAGFELHPQMRMVGRVERALLPAVRGLRDGDAHDIEWMDDLDERRRGGGHGPDHELLLATQHLTVSSPPRPAGYVYTSQDRRPHLLAADDATTASDLLVDALASTTGPTLVNCITAQNHWAVDVGLTARMDIGQEGYLALRDMRPPSPYLPSGHFL
jgi:ribosomal protein S18 acetylase RimI-like enzyme